MTYADGSRYDGEWEANVQHGSGTLDAAGVAYSGEWRAGRRHGKGKLQLFGRYVYQGEWRNDRRCGAGSETDVSGGTFAGAFDANGARHGAGTVTHSQTNLRVKATWKNNKPVGDGALIDESKQSKAIEFNDDGTQTTPMRPSFSNAMPILYL